MGYANAQRMLNYIRIFTEFFSQPEYLNVIPMLGILNEPVLPAIGMNTLVSLCVSSTYVHIRPANVRLPVIWKSTT